MPALDGASVSTGFVAPVGSVVITGLTINPGDTIVVKTHSAAAAAGNLAGVTGITGNGTFAAAGAINSAAGFVRTDEWICDRGGVTGSSLTIAFSGTPASMVVSVDVISGATGIGATNTATGNSATAAVAVSMTDAAAWLVGGAASDNGGAANWTMTSPNVRDSQNGTTTGAVDTAGCIGHNPSVGLGNLTLTATQALAANWTIVATEIKGTAAGAPPDADTPRRSGIPQSRLLLCNRPFGPNNPLREMKWNDTGAGVTGAQYNLSLDGGVTPSGDLIRQTNRPLAGAATPSGALQRMTAKSFSGAATPAGILSRQAQRSLSGAMTPSATLSSSHLFNVILSGAMTPVGTLVRQARKQLAGAMTPGGVLSRQTSRALTGAATPAGTLSRQAQRQLSGSVTPSGGLLRRAQRALLASITPSGTLSSTKVALKSLTGGLTPSGALVRATFKVLSGGSTPQGALVRRLARLLAGASTPAGALSRQAQRPLAGAVTPSGVLAKSKVALKALVGALTPAGSLATNKTTARSLSGAVTPAGALQRRAGRSLTGAATPTGALSRQARRSLSGQVDSSGALSRRSFKQLTGAVASSGAVQRAKTMYRSLSGTIAPQGSLLAELTTRVFYIGKGWISAVTFWFPHDESGQTFSSKDDDHGH